MTMRDSPYPSPSLVWESSLSHPSSSAQDQQQKQLELILAITKTRKLYDTKRVPDGGALHMGHKNQTDEALKPVDSRQVQAAAGQKEDKRNAGSDLLPIGGAENDADDDPLPLSIHFSDMPMISFDAMQLANSTVEDVMDTLNEKMYQGCGSRGNVYDKSFYSEANSSWLFNIGTLESDLFRPPAFLLQRHELLAERIKDELRDGTEYWALERKLCGEPSSKMEISVEDVMRTIHVKSFDYRVLNLLLYQLRGEEEGVLENNFNILRMLLRIYGTSKAPTMLAKVISEAEEKYDHLLKSMDPQLVLSYQRRCEEATKEGGKITGHPLGSWTIPPLIADEKFYRSMFGSYKQ
ncbi:hypothetical protein Ancab_026314 [Ancistrocladus abbreviatus]